MPDLIPVSDPCPLISVSEPCSFQKRIFFWYRISVKRVLGTNFGALYLSYPEMEGTYFFDFFV